MKYIFPILMLFLAELKEKFTKGQREAVLRPEAVDPAAQDGRHEHGEHGAGVDGEVEEGEELGALARLLRAELVGGERRHARLDAAGNKF
jgi:hypothetical protein